MASCRRRFAKTILTTRKGFVRVVVHASRRLDLGKVRDVLDTTRVSCERECACGCLPRLRTRRRAAAGGPIDVVLLDARLCGHETAVIEVVTRDEDLVRLTEAMLGDICHDSRGERPRFLDFVSHRVGPRSTLARSRRETRNRTLRAATEGAPDGCRRAARLPPGYARASQHPTPARALRPQMVMDDRRRLVTNRPARSTHCVAQQHLP